MNAVRERLIIPLSYMWSVVVHVLVSALDDCVHSAWRGAWVDKHRAHRTECAMVVFVLFIALDWKVGALDG